VVKSEQDQIVRETVQAMLFLNRECNLVVPNSYAAVQEALERKKEAKRNPGATTKWQGPCT
jgi:hypothetical protein